MQINKMEIFHVRVFHHEYHPEQDLKENKEDEKVVNTINNLSKFETLSDKEKSIIIRLKADSHNKLGQIEEATFSYEQSLSHDSGNYKSYRGLGSVSLQLSQYKLSLSFFETALKLNLEDEKANLGIAISHFHLQNIQESIFWLEKTLAINPYSHVALSTLLQISFQNNEFEKIESSLLTYLEKFPIDIKVLLMLGKVYKKQNNDHEYHKIIDQIRKIDPENVQLSVLENKKVSWNNKLIS